MKKKLLSVMLAIVLMLTNAITIYASTEDTVIASSDKTELKVGETFTITVEVSATSGVAAVSGFSYSYDTEKLELENETIASTFMSVVEDDVRVLMYIGEQANSVEMATLTFSVKEGIVAGTTASVNFDEMVVASIDNPNVSENTPILIQPISITVIEDEDTQGGGGNETCSHTTYEAKYNDTYHWEECSECNEIKEGSRELHTYGTYTDNGDGTHSATCTVCNYKLTEKHNIADGKCTQCNAVATETGDDDKKPTQEPGQEQPTTDGLKVDVGGDKDPTIADKDYDKAGVNAIIIISIIVVSIGAVVIYRKNQSYKDIK